MFTIYIKFEINLAAPPSSPPCNYVHICSKTKRQTWLLMAFSFKSLWTLGRTAQCDDISAMSWQGFNVQGERSRNWSLSFPCSSLVKLQNCPNFHLSIRLSTTKYWNLKGCSSNFEMTTRTCRSRSNECRSLWDLKWKHKNRGNADISSLPGGHISHRLHLSVHRIFTPVPVYVGH